MPSDQTTPVRQCSDCGFLERKVRYLGEGPRHNEVSQNERDTGDVAGRYNGDDLDGIVGCLRAVVDLRAEVEAACTSAGADGEATRAAIALPVLNKPRACGKWTKYKPGFSPKEHLEEVRMLELEAHRRDWESSQETERRQWIKQREDANAAREERENTLIRRLTYVGILLGVISLMAASPDSPLGKVMSIVIPW